MTLIVSFWLPLLATVASVVSQGASAVFILVMPLVLPVLMTWFVAKGEYGLGGISTLLAGPLGTKSPQLSSDVLVRLASAVVETEEQGEPGINAVVKTEAELEMANLMIGIRRVAAASAMITQSRVREIVRAMLTASSEPIPDRITWEDRVRLLLSGAVRVCVPWIALSIGLVVVGLAGGVPPNPFAAALVGFLGSTIGVLLTGNRTLGTALKAAN